MLLPSSSHSVHSNEYRGWEDQVPLACVQSTRLCVVFGSCNQSYNEILPSIFLLERIGKLRCSSLRRIG